MTDIETRIEFFGKELKVSEITNPHLRRVMTDKRASGYGDHSKHTCWGDWSEYGDHREKYHEYSVYQDYQALS